MRTLRRRLRFQVPDLPMNDLHETTIILTHFAVGGPFFYPTNTWQELNWEPEYASDDFWLFCNNITNLDASHNTTQTNYALSQYTSGEELGQSGQLRQLHQRLRHPHLRRRTDQ